MPDRAYSHFEYTVRFAVLRSDDGTVRFEEELTWTDDECLDDRNALRDAKGEIDRLGYHWFRILSVEIVRVRVDVVRTVKPQ